MIYHQLTGPTTARRLVCPTLQFRPLSYRSEHELYRIPMAGDLSSKVTRVVI